MKKIALVPILFLMTLCTAYASFPDVPQDHEHFKAIDYLQTKGVIGGYEDGTYMPDNPVNRVEALKIILLSSGVEIGEEFESSLPDVPEDAWFYSYVGEALKRGIVAGYDDFTFRPANQINLVETLKMAILAFSLEVPESGTNWYDKYLDFALSKNIILLDDEGLSHPDEVMTRASFSEILYRFAFMKENGLDSFPLSQDWEYYEKSSDYYRLKIPPLWETRQENTRTVFWRKTEGQIDYHRLTPESATLILHKKDNGSFFEELDCPETTVYGMPAKLCTISETARDYYISLPNSKVLIAYCETGGGSLKDQNMRFLEAAVKNLTFIESSEPDLSAEKTALMKKINQNILVEGSGLSTVNSLPDADLFSTDAIGVGTGPVDYYYSLYLDLTLKYERASDVILNVRNGKTTKF